MNEVGNYIKNKEIKSFYSLLLNSFFACYGPIFTFIGISLTIISFFLIPGSTIDLKYLIIGIIIFIYLLILLLHASWTAFYSVKQLLPNVRYVIPTDKYFKSKYGTLLLDPSVLFSFNTVVSIYYIQDEMELFIGLGKVINIQENKKVQVAVTHIFFLKDIWDGVLKNQVDKLRRLRIKPAVPEFVLEELNNV